MAISSRDAKRQRRAGTGSGNPGRYVPRQMPDSPGLVGGANAALTASTTDLAARARALGIAAEGRPGGEIALDVALAEALHSVGSPDPAAAAAVSAAAETSTVERAVAAAAAGAAAEVAIVAALASRRLAPS